MQSKLSNSLMKSYAVMSASSIAAFIPPLTETFLNFSNCLCYLLSHSPYACSMAVQITLSVTCSISSMTIALLLSTADPVSLSTLLY
ncbi:hypothetical protein IGI04_012322 [Brassica rapa subsp. trilocularis]|uniref:Uncharacterized protein n=1 Tax=Brassica rapa subsp. trilocularis TaxID=1813537 RepID=A0ABQ7N5L5_BRACM|nr:hypothetical protein IGI04_012322 [Brassica rapa subsp. trilocularis]